MGGSECGLQGEGGWGLGGLQVVIQGGKGFVSVWRRATKSSLEDK